MAGSRVELSKDNGKRMVSVKTEVGVPVAMSDEWACADLLVQMANQSKLDPEVCELNVKTGTKNRTFTIDDVRRQGIKLR